MLDQDLLDILRCPACVQEKDGLLDFYRQAWLICKDCGRKYPVVDDIPVMLISTGDKWLNVAIDDLPVPPPPVK
ncbi:MAG: Trm112 family protein [Anaerolineales bacterium]